VYEDPVTLVRQTVLKARWRPLLGVLLVCLLGAGCDSGGDGSQPQAAEWNPDSTHFALTYDAACDEPCEHFDGSYTVIYRGSQPTTAQRIQPGGPAPDRVSHAEVHFLPSPLELIELTDSVEDLDQETGLPGTARRGDITYSDIAVAYDIADATAALAVARSEWAAADIAEYRLSYSRGCFCLVTGAVTFEVRDGQATLVDSANGYGPGDVRSGVPTTVEDLFDRIERWIIVARADYFTLAFGESGVPLRFSGDVAGSIDEEFSYGSIRIEEIP
jgi:hypothetical protein